MKHLLHLSSIVIVIAQGVALNLALTAVVPTLQAAEVDLQTGVTIMANNGGYVGRAGPRLIANRDSLDEAELFDIQTYDDGTVSLRCQSNGKLLTSFNGRRPVGCLRRNMGPQQKFHVESLGEEGGSIALLCSNGRYLSSENGSRAMTCNRPVARSWETFTTEGDTDEPSTEQPLIIGNFSILDDRGVSAPNVSGVVYIPADAADFEGDLAPVTTGDDTCVVTRFEDDQPLSYPIPATPDAGEVIVLSSPAGTYTELLRLQDGYQVEPVFMYRLLAGDNATRPVPDGLTLDVPGGEVVPALSGLRFPDIDTLELIEPAPARNIQVTPETTYRWIPGGNPDATIEITVSTDELYFNCSARDDGEFVVPQDTLADIGSQYVGTFDRIMRVASSIAYREGRVAYRLSHSNGYNAFNNPNNLDYFP